MSTKHLLPLFPVPERSHVSQRDTEVPHGDRRRERQPVRGAVRHAFHAHHVSTQTGGLASDSQFPIGRGGADAKRALCVQMLPLNTNIRLAYANGKDDEQNFIQNLSLFLCTFLKEHGQLIEKRLNLRETLMEVGEMPSISVVMTEGGEGVSLLLKGQSRSYNGHIAHLPPPPPSPRPSTTCC